MDLSWPLPAALEVFDGLEDLEAAVLGDRFHVAIHTL